MTTIRRAILLLAWATSGAANAQTLASNLADLSLEQLGSIVVTTVSRRAEPLAGAPASVYVITGEDIRRAGSTSLAEALRLAPNLQVARADANQYAISARGFNNVLANKMLVLIDGRTVYSPLFSGTFWEVQDVMLDDVERIEVISGPGSALWGANAVNGVINVITRRAGDTQGQLTTLETGTTQRDVATRYGGRIGDGYYRAYAKSVRRDNSAFGNGTPIRDAAEHQQAGFRADWGRPADGFTLQGDAYGEQIDQAPAPRDLAGMNLLARWSRTLENRSALQVQGYLDRTARLQPGSIREHLDTLDLDVQHALAPLGAHRLIWGFGLRQYQDRIENTPLLGFQPPSRSLQRNNLYAQDEIALRQDLDLTLGAKIETNSYTGAELLPSGRLAWRPVAAQMLWAALSRAVRAPSRIDREFVSPSTAPFTFLAGGPQFQSETVDVVEVGHRAQISPRLSYSLAVFRQSYRDLRTLEITPAGPQFLNDMEGESTGVETWATWRAADWARLSAGFVHQHVSLRVRPGTTDLQSPAATGNDPGEWWKLRASLDLGARHELDLMLRHYRALPNPVVPAYTAFDARLAWRAAKDVQIELIAQNLFDPRHAEWGTAASRAEVERAVFAKLRLGLR